MKVFGDLLSSSHCGNIAGWRCVFALFLLVAPSPIAAAEPRVQVIETAPSSPATLGHWEPFHLRIGYVADRAIRVRANAFFQNKQVTSISSGSPRYEPGTEEAYVWLAYTEAARVDKILVTAEDDATRKPLAQTELPVDLTWTGIKQPMASRPYADWVERMRAENERRSKAETVAYMNRPAPWWEGGLSLALIWAGPFYFVMQVALLKRFREGWRRAAAVPAVPMVGVLIYTVYAFLAGSNLFPLILIFTAPFALLYLLGLIVVRHVVLRNPHEEAAAVK
ncbi:MAG: hypothetical protein ACREJU_19985 [Nitrospiraceae bacterium]